VREKSTGAPSRWSEEEKEGESIKLGEKRKSTEKKEKRALQSYLGFSFTKSKKREPDQDLSPSACKGFLEILTLGEEGERLIKRGKGFSRGENNVFKLRKRENLLLILLTVSAKEGITGEKKRLSSPAASSETAREEKGSRQERKGHHERPGDR